MPPAGYPAFLQYLQSGRVREIELPGHRGGESQRGREVASLFIDSDGVRGRAGEAHQSDLDAIEFLVGFTHPAV